jgi:hypothetical protein
MLLLAASLTTRFANRVAASALSLATNFDCAAAAHGTHTAIGGRTRFGRGVFFSWVLHDAGKS